ncbi:MAG TPA: hypothetical protein VEB40_10250 [Flavipsychrobacter sp.]|nr:hypothetical protein [Flavipsychrobacter sp.]
MIDFEKFMTEVANLTRSTSTKDEYHDGWIHAIEAVKQLAVQHALGTLEEDSTKNFLIISLKHGSGKSPMFWRPQDAGYTSSPFAAGLYREDKVKSDSNYYNNGDSTIAVPVTEKIMGSIGFSCSYDEDALQRFFEKNMIND